MSSSMSSEHAFSQGRIMILKRCSCLKGDIMEALQCIKCAVCHDLLFHELGPSSTLEAEETSDNKQEDLGVEAESGQESDMEECSWDELLIEDEDKEAVRYSD
jgi:hypothetical protein